MTKFLELLISGISLGCIYALISLGFSILYKASDTVNFAHGSLVVLGAFLVATVVPRFGFGVAVGVAVVGVAAVAVFLQVAFVTRIRRAPLVSLALMTIGADVIMSTFLKERIGSDVLNVGHPWGSHAVGLGPVFVAVNRLVALGVTAVILTVFYVAFRYSGWGVALRAVAADRATAELMGLRVGRVQAGAWAVAGVLAALAGVFLTGSPTPGLNPGVGQAALRAVPAAVLGGLDSTFGALVGGLLIGVTESMAAGYQDSLLFLGRDVGDVVPYVVMFAVLMIRPSGLFGSKEALRV